MASGFFAILDDITALMDDVAVTAKVASRKTAGILGDDLAVNAEKATGFLASRELPVLWAITKGSLINKLIIVPIALLLSLFLPAAIKIVLILGGFYLAYEGVEKIIEYFFHHPKEGHKVIEEKENDKAAEDAKVRSAITTDFILSVEIVIIALGTVADESLTIRAITVSVVALLATIGVYGIVALIVRMDDAGYKLMRHANNKGFLAGVGSLLVKLLPVVIKILAAILPAANQHRPNNKGFLAGVGSLLVKLLPVVIKILAVVGTIALILVSGGIFTHNIDYLHHIFAGIPVTIKELIFGLTAGLLAVAVISGGKKAYSLLKK